MHFQFAYDLLWLKWLRMRVLKKMKRDTRFLAFTLAYQPKEWAIARLGKYQYNQKVFFHWDTKIGVHS